MDGLQISTLFLDDGNRDTLWHLCFAEWNQEEKQILLNLLEHEYLIRGKIQKDNRYVSFDAISSKRIDEMILRNIHNDLDIIKKKITNNDKIKEYKKSLYVITDTEKIGINRYCRAMKINAKIIIPILYSMNLDFNEINEIDLLNIVEKNNAKI